MKRFFIYCNALLYLLFFFALSSRTSTHPAVFGRYSLRFAFLLLAYLLLFYPFIKAVSKIVTSSRMSLRKGKFFKLTPSVKTVLYLTILFLCLMPLEVYIRLNFTSAFREKNIKAFHPFLQMTPPPGDSVWHINAYGFRGDEIKLQKEKGTFRIFVMGGSTVFSHDQPFEKSHCRILEKLLQSYYPDRKIEVMNAGVPWHTSEHSLIRYLFDVKDFDPDLIIIWHGMNDLYRSFLPKDFSYGKFHRDYSHYLGPVSNMVFNYFKPPPLFEVHLVSVSYLLRTIKEKLIPRISVGVEADRKEFPSLESFERNMTAFVQNVNRIDHVMLILATQPSLYRDGLNAKELESMYFDRLFMLENNRRPTVASLAYGMALFDGKTKSIAARYRIPLLDLDAKIPKTEEYFWDSCHYTEKGNALVAKELFEFIQKGRFISAKAP